MRIKDYISTLCGMSKGYRGSIIAYAIIGICHVGFSLLFIAICKYLVDIGAGQERSNFALYACAMISVAVCQLVCSAAMSRISVISEMKLINSLRHRYFMHMMHSRWMGREQMHTGDIVERISSDTATIAGLICRTFPSSIVTIVRLIAAVIFLFYLDLRLLITLIFIMPIALGLSKLYYHKMRQLTTSIRKSDSKIRAILQEKLQFRTLISTLLRTQQVERQLCEQQDTLLRDIDKRNTFSTFSRTTVSFGFMAGYSAAFLWGVNGMIEGSVTFGMVTAFLQLVNQIQRPMVDLTSQIPTFVTSVIAVDRLKELSNIELEEISEPIYLEGQLGVKFKDVTFVYPKGERKVVDHFSYTFAPGSVTAIVGETGVGKSTLMRLILALIKQSSGEVTIFNNKESYHTSPALRANIVYIPQGNSLLSGTIRENLLLGNPAASETQIKEALHTAVADFVYSLPKGLDTQCGELGNGLSEGQAQRIAIARGLLQTGNIILLDEPTSALDIETERLLLERLQKNITGRTMIIITHRHEITKLCNSTLLLK